MIDLTLESPGSHHYIRSVNDAGIRIGDTLYTGAITVTPDQILEHPGIRSMEEFLEQHLELVFSLDPEVALLGTGTKHQLLDREAQVALCRRGRMLEVMSTAAACRTFNVLVADQRRVIAALLPITHDG